MASWAPDYGAVVAPEGVVRGWSIIERHLTSCANRVKPPHKAVGYRTCREASQQSSFRRGTCVETCCKYLMVLNAERSICRALSQLSWKSHPPPPPPPLLTVTQLGPDADTAWRRDPALLSQQKGRPIRTRTRTTVPSHLLCRPRRFPPPAS